MSLYRRTLLLVILTGIVALAAMIGVSDVIITKQFTHLEQENFSKDIDRLKDAIGTEFSALQSKNGDWSNWDDLYNYSQDLNAQFAKVNLIDNSFVQLEISTILIFNQSGKLVFSKAVDTEVEQEIPVPQNFLEIFGNQIFAANEIDGLREMIVGDEDKLYFATGKPILNSLGEGPNHGTLFFIKEVDEALVAKLADTIHNDTAVYVIPTTNISSDIQTALINSQDGIYSAPLNDKIIEGFLLSRDIDEKPVAIWKIARERLIVAQGKRTVLTFVIFFIIASLVYGLVMLSSMYGLILKRLSKAVKAADELDSNDTKKRLPVEGNDEISKMTQAINRLLDRLDRTLESSKASSQEIEKRNKELETINESMVNREIKMAELKAELKRLQGEKK